METSVYSGSVSTSAQWAKQSSRPGSPYLTPRPWRLVLGSQNTKRGCYYCITQQGLPAGSELGGPCESTKESIQKRERTDSHRAENTSSVDRRRTRDRGGGTEDGGKKLDKHPSRAKEILGSEDFEARPQIRKDAFYVATSTSCGGTRTVTLRPKEHHRPIRGGRYEAADGHV